MTRSEKTRHIVRMRIWRWRNARFLVPQIKKINVKVQFLSYSCQRTFLLTFTITYEGNYRGEISLHFNLPSLYSCRTQSLLLCSLGGSPFTRRGRVWYNPYTAVVLMECNNCRSLTRHRPLANQNIVSHAIIRNAFCKNSARARIYI